MKNLLLLYAVLFIIGAIGNYFSIRKRQMSKQKAWTKYFIYLFIILLNTIIFNSVHFKFWYICLLGTLAVIELWKACKVNKNWSLLILAYLFLGMALWALFYHDSDTLINTYLIVLVLDGFSQIGGQLFGQKQLAKTISPNKTVGGLVIGAISAILVFCIYQYLLSNNITISASKLFFCFVIIIGGIFGDLASSFIKRKASIKDFANYIPQHGGVLDRMDSYFGALISASIFSLLDN